MWFPLHREKVEKEAECSRKKINLYSPPPLTGLKIRWNFATICHPFARSVGTPVNKLRKRRQNKINYVSRAETEWLVVASQISQNIYISMWQLNRWMIGRDFSFIFV